MNKQFNVVGTLTVKDGKLEAAKQILLELAIETRKEPGNIDYFIIEDTTTPNTVFSIEKWENAEDEAKHWETPHLGSAFEKLSPLLDGEASVTKGYEIS